MKYRWQLHKLENECSRIQKQYAKYKKGLSGSKLQEVDSEEGSEIWPVLEEIDRLKSRRLCQIADRLMVPLPDIQDKEQWKEQSYGQGRVLTSKGLWELRKLVREEKRERREGFVVWLAALTGIIGAMTGLAAVLSR